MKICGNRELLGKTNYKLIIKIQHNYLNEEYSF